MFLSWIFAAVALPTNFVIYRKRLLLHDVQDAFLCTLLLTFLAALKEKETK